MYFLSPTTFNLQLINHQGSLLPKEEGRSKKSEQERNRRSDSFVCKIAAGSTSGAIGALAQHTQSRHWKRRRVSMGISHYIYYTHQGFFIELFSTQRCVTCVTKGLGNFPPCCACVCTRVPQRLPRQRKNRPSP